MARWNTAQVFINETLGGTYDMDGYPTEQKYQCWDYGDYFWVNQVGRALITKPGGHGSARDCWLVSRIANAGSDFILITDKKQLAVGDWCVFNNGGDGHIGIIKSIIKVGELVILQGENQGSIRVNAIQRNLSDFLGAFRYKGWQNAAQPVTKKKTDTEIAKEVIKGLWGNGDERKQRLTKAGYNYNTIQGIVNQMLAPKPNKKSNETIAKEVIKGLWGNGEERKQRLTKAGYNYNTIQGIVNQMLR